MTTSTLLSITVGVCTLSQGVGGGTYACSLQRVGAVPFNRSPLGGRSPDGLSTGDQETLLGFVKQQQAGGPEIISAPLLVDAVSTALLLWAFAGGTVYDIGLTLDIGGAWSVWKLKGGALLPGGGPGRIRIPCYVSLT